MTAIVTSTPTRQGDALRTAAAEVADTNPVLAAVLRRQAADLDRIPALDAAVASFSDSRGRWVRRTRSNAGPGLSGIGHIAIVARKATETAAETMCGRRLVGSLDWEMQAHAERLAPSGWRPCLGCHDALLAVEAVA